MAQEKERNQRIKREIYGISLLAFGVFILYCVTFPYHSGVVGKWIYMKMHYLIGIVSYLFPMLCILIGIRLFYVKEIKWKEHLIGTILFVGGFSVLFGLLMFSIASGELGGVIGRLFSHLFRKLVGTFGAYAVSLTCIAASVVILLRISVRKGISWSFNQGKKVVSFLLTKAAIKDVSEKDTPRIYSNAKKKEEQRKNRANLKHKPITISGPAAPGKPNMSNMSNISKDQKNKPDSKTTVPIVSSDTLVEVKEYVLPSSDLLKEPPSDQTMISEEELKNNAEVLQTTLRNFDVDAHVVNIHPGPVITRYELELAPGVKVNTITSLENDICLAMKAASIRILAPIPGKSAIGIEIPNLHPCPVTFREIVESKEFLTTKSKLPFAVGKTVSGNVQVADITTMPHLLIAGATGSGKSVCVNTLIMSILYRAKPNEVKFILIDPKMVELSLYQDIPHLYSPVITNPKEASKVLQNVLMLMERRYQKFSEESARNIESYNAKMEKSGGEKESYLIVIIDELADLMLIASRDVEESIARLTQMARAVGIHVVLATQRPSVDVITGVIKANLPSRIAFQVLSKGDSRVILDANGADDLLGRGDMLFLGNGAPKPVRLQGAFLSETEIHNVLDFVKAQAVPDYNLFHEELKVARGITGEEEEDDGSEEALVRRALRLIVERRKVSYELLKANGFSGPKATNLLSLLEMRGFIEKPTGTNRWEIYFDEIYGYLNG